MLKQGLSVLLPIHTLGHLDCSMYHDYAQDDARLAGPLQFQVGVMLCKPIMQHFKLVCGSIDESLGAD